MKFIATKTDNGQEKGEISFYCRVPDVTRQGFYRYAESLEKPWKYAALAAQIKEIIAEDECNDTYTSVIENCFDNAVLGLSMDDNMRAGLCVNTLENAVKAYPGLRGAIVRGDRGNQYTGDEYRRAVSKYGIIQSMNSAGGRCHDNAKCESLWARFKEEILYGGYDTTKMTMAEMKSLIWRYFISSVL